MKKIGLGVVLLVTFFAGAVLIVPRMRTNEIHSWELVREHLAPGKFVQTGPYTTHYRVKGEGPPLILLHGFLYHSMTWDRVLDALALKFRVYALDLLGFGYSSRLESGDYSYSLYAEQVRQFMDALGLTTASVVGHSMGGGTAIQFAVQHPERVDKLILVDSAGLPRPPSVTERIYALPFLGEFFLALPPKANLKRTLQSLVFHDPTLVTDAYVDAVGQPLQIVGSGRAVLNILRSRMAGGLRVEVERLGGVGKPILLLWGREDKLLPLALGEEMHRLLPGSRLEVLDGVGHNPHEEAPEKATDVLVEFLRAPR